MQQRNEITYRFLLKISTWIFCSISQDIKENEEKLPGDTDDTDSQDV